MSNNFQLFILYCGHMCGGFLMTVIGHVCLYFGCPCSKYFRVWLWYFSLDACIYYACEVFALMVVFRSGIKLGWLIHLMVCPNDFISGRLVNTCSAGCNNCRCCIDTHFTLPTLSCHFKNALSEISLQIWKTGFIFGIKSVFWGMVS